MSILWRDTLMKLRDIPSSIAELNQLAENTELGQLSQEVRVSNFYLRMQITEKLDASYLANNLTPKAFILLAKIAATSPTLHTLDIRGNGLYNFDTPTLIELADTIASSPTLHTLDIRGNGLYNFDTPTLIELADTIASSPTLHTIDIRRNFLGEHIVAFVDSLLRSNIQAIDMRWNSIQEGINREAIITLIKDRNQEVLEWAEALKFFGAIVGPLGTYGEVVSVISEVAFSTCDGYLTQGEETIAFYTDDSCVIN
jgi:hypothetical protein